MGGAQPRQVVRSIFLRAAAQIALGLTVGVALALVMAAVGVLAALGPARRGLKIQPTEALRADG